MLLISNQVTKEHFDEKIKSLEKRIDGQEEKLKVIDDRVNKIEDDMPNDIYEEMHEQEIRKKNVIIFGLKEQSGNNGKERYVKDMELAGRLLSAMKDIDLYSEGKLGFRILRLGRYNENSASPRPLKVSFSKSLIRDIVLSCCKHLKGKSEWQGVSVTPDLTKVQQKLSKAKRVGLQKDSDKKNNDRKDHEVNTFQYKVLGHYGLGNLRIAKINLEDE